MRTRRIIAFSLTDDTIERLDHFADYLGLSKSEVVERILSFRLPLLTDELPNDVNEPPAQKAA
jgi:hypothetical protein